MVIDTITLEKKCQKIKLGDVADLIKNIPELIDKFYEKNKNLRATRDLLLPKLISGKLDVSNLDIKIREGYFCYW